MKRFPLAVTAILLLAPAIPDARGALKGYHLTACGDRVAIEARMIREVERAKDFCEEGTRPVRFGGMTCRKAKVPKCPEGGLSCNTQFECVPGTSPATAETSENGAPSETSDRNAPTPRDPQDRAAEEATARPSPTAEAKSAPPPSEPRPTTLPAAREDPLPETSRATPNPAAPPSTSATPVPTAAATILPTATPTPTGPSVSISINGSPVPLDASLPPSADSSLPGGITIDPPLLLKFLEKVPKLLEKIPKPAALDDPFVALVVFLLGVLVAIALVVGGMGRMFEKAGVGAWTAWIPLYSQFKLHEIAGHSGWWFLVDFSPIGMVSYGYMNFQLARRFGFGLPMAIAMTFLPFLAYPYLGFSAKVEYRLV